MIGSTALVFVFAEFVVSSLVLAPMATGPRRSARRPGDDSVGGRP